MPSAANMGVDNYGIGQFVVPQPSAFGSQRSVQNSGVAELQRQQHDATQERAHAQTMQFNAAQAAQRQGDMNLRQQSGYMITDPRLGRGGKSRQNKQISVKAFKQKKAKTMKHQ
jgi:hypothetical protein